MTKVDSTPFSDFIKNASHDEKAKVYREVIDAATARQIATLFPNQSDNQLDGEKPRG